MCESSAAAHPPPLLRPPVTIVAIFKQDSLSLSHIEILPKGSRKSCSLPAEQKLRGRALEGGDPVEAHPRNPYRRENVGSLTRDSLHFGQEGGGKVEQKSIKFDLTAAAPDGRSLETRERGKKRTGQRSRKSEV